MPPNAEKTRPRRSLFWLLCLKSLQVKRPQALLGIGSLLAGAAVCSLLLNLYGGVGRKMAESFSAFGANVILTPRDAGSQAGSLPGTMPRPPAAGLEAMRRNVPGALSVSELFVVARLDPATPDLRFPDGENVVAVGARLPGLLAMNSNWRVEGKITDLGSADCLVGAHLAREMGLRPGSQLKLGALPAPAGAREPAARLFHVAAVVSTGGSADDQVFVPLDTLQRIAGLADQVSVVEVRVPAGARQIEAAMRELRRAYPSLAVRPVRQIVYSEGRVLGTIQRLMLALTALILAIIALCVAAVMSAIVLERQKDVAVMKALGASDRLVMELFLLEGAVLGLLGGTAGFFVGALCAREVAIRLFDVALAPVWWVLPAVCFAAALLAVLATMFPVRRVRAIQPAVALKGA
ncbi:MAG: ABC transporter permease [Terriglobia bacterium]